MSNYIELTAEIKNNIKILAQQLKDEGNEDLAILLTFCYDNFDNKREFVKNSMKLIAEEIEKRTRMKVCPKCKAVMHPDKPCEKCGASLYITSPA